MAKIQILIAMVACVYAVLGAPQTMIVTQDTSNQLSGSNLNSAINSIKNSQTGPVLFVQQSHKSGLEGTNVNEGVNALESKQDAGAAVVSQDSAAQIPAAPAPAAPEVPAPADTPAPVVETTAPPAPETPAPGNVVPPYAAACNPSLLGLPGYRCRNGYVVSDVQRYGSASGWKASYGEQQTVATKGGCGLCTCHSTTGTSACDQAAAGVATQDQSASGSAVQDQSAAGVAGQSQVSGAAGSQDNSLSLASTGGQSSSVLTAGSMSTSGSASQHSTQTHHVSVDQPLGPQCSAPGVCAPKGPVEIVKPCTDSSCYPAAYVSLTDGASGYSSSHYKKSSAAMSASNEERYDEARYGAYARPPRRY